MSPTKTATAAVIILGAMHTTPVRADETPRPESTVSVSGSARGAFVHDGFYLRIATGFGAYSENIRKSGDDNDTLVTGISSVTELALGGTLRDGLVIGGGFFGSEALASNQTVRGTTPPAEIIQSRASFTIIGPFADYYFDPRRGLHMQAALGLATVRGFNLQSAEFDRHSLAIGAGAMIGFGYEWWVSREWSIGVLGRLTAAVATGEDGSNVRWNHTLGGSPSVLFTGTYN